MMAFSRKEIIPSHPSSSKPSSDTHPITTIPGKYIGIADLPNQVYRRVLKNGFKLNLLIIGESGVGKSALINSLFGVDVYNQTHILPPSQRITEKMMVEKNPFLIESKGVKVMVNVLDVPSFGHLVDNSPACDFVCQYIDQQFHKYFMASHQNSSQMNRVDGRVHCCLYVIPPTGHSLRPLDISTMKKLGTKTNLIPVIGRADTLTLEERNEFKKKIRNDLKKNDIQVYYFPTDDEESGSSPGRTPKDDMISDDEDSTDVPTIKTDQDMAMLLPFAIIGSNQIITGKDGKKIRIRSYPWGRVDVEDSRYSDLSILRQLLLFTHLPDLVGITDGLHYSNYIREFLCKIGPVNSRYISRDLLPQDSESDVCIEKLEKGLQMIFDQKVAEKTQKLDEIAAELKAKYAEWEKVVAARMQKLHKEREDFEHQKLVLIQAYPLLQGRLAQEGVRTSVVSGRT